jgi:hypothetical protein
MSVINALNKLPVYTCRGLWIGGAGNGVRGERESAESDHCEMQGERGCATAAQIVYVVCRARELGSARWFGRSVSTLYASINEPGMCKQFLISHAH